MKAALDLNNDPLKSFIAPEGASKTQITLQMSMLLNMVDEIRAKLNGLDRADGSRDAVGATITKLTESIPYLQKSAEVRQTLAAPVDGMVRQLAVNTEGELSPPRKF